MFAHGNDRQLYGIYWSSCRHVLRKHGSIYGTETFNESGRNMACNQCVVMRIVLDLRKFFCQQTKH